MPVLIETDLPNLHYRGKVRDTYEMDGDMFLLIATDRVSAFGSDRVSAFGSGSGSGRASRSSAA